MSKTGSSFFPKINKEEVSDLIKRVIEKNKKELSVKQRYCLNNLANKHNNNINNINNLNNLNNLNNINNIKNINNINCINNSNNLNSKGRFILNRQYERPSTQSASNLNKLFLYENIKHELFLTDVYFWRKHEELWEKLSDLNKINDLNNNLNDLNNQSNINVLNKHNEFESFFIPKYESEID